MTLKDYMKKKYPEAVRSEYSGGVRGVSKRL